jgi:hypothetical protein
VTPESDKSGAAKGKPTGVEATIEVVQLQQAADREALEGAHLDRPKAGPIEGRLVLAAGWVLGRRAEVVSVEVAHAYEVLCRAPLRVDRPDVIADYPDAAISGPVGFRANVDVSGLPDDFTLYVTAMLEDGSAAAIGSIVGRRNRQAGAVTDSAPVIDAPSLRPDLGELLAGLGSANGAASPTGEAEDERLVAQLNVAGKNVLHVGSGRGDLSRDARRAGAEIVDGLEADGGLVTIARLLNAYNGTTRVSFFERDLRDPESYRERYDVVLALSIADLPEDIIATLIDNTDTLVAGLPPDADRASRLVSMFESSALDMRMVDGSSRRYAIVTHRGRKE